MVFSSIVFLGLFLPIVLLLYFGTNSRRVRNYVLLAASLFFYAWGEPVWIITMVFTSFVDFFCAKWIQRIDGGGAGEKTRASAAHRRMPLVFSVVINIGILFVFKYSGFLAGEIYKLTGVMLPAWNSAMPIGISFYTFQSLSYTIDVYRGHTKVQNNFFYYLMYVSMFPQLVAGPIVRYADIAAQIEERRENLKSFSGGAVRFCVGLGKKVILANNAGQVVSTLMLADYLHGIPTLNAWIAAVFFTFQIYFDFSAYSDMAIGLGKMFGFDYKENFRYPYMAWSVTEFWRRWHISLSTFFRDYVYIPLGGGKNKQYRNIFGVWLLTGIWHGASWNYLLWGLYYAFFLMVEKKFFARIFDRHRLVGRIVTIFLFVYGWVIFYCEDLGLLGSMTAALFCNSAVFIDALGTNAALGNLFVLPVYLLASTDIAHRAAKAVFRSESAEYLAQAAFVICVFGASIVLLVGQSYNPFLYFRF